MKTLCTLKTELLADPDTRAEYDAMADEFSIAHELIVARSCAGLTQGRSCATYWHHTERCGYPGACCIDWMPEPAGAGETSLGFIARMAVEGRELAHA